MKIDGLSKKNTLGVDWGFSRIGIAIATSGLVTPLEVVSVNESLKRIKEIANEYKVEVVVVGMPEGKNVDYVQKFVESIKKQGDWEVVSFDETLTSSDAQAMAIESGIKRSRRKAMEDAFQAAVLLQNYLER